MTVPAAPHTRLLNLISGAWTASSEGRSWLGGSRGEVWFYSRARWGLVDAINLLSGKRSGVDIFCPAYFCDETVEALRSVSGSMKFYPLNGDMNPNWEALGNLSGERFSILILVHFFGFPSDIGRAERFCRERGFGLIEDAAHVLLPGPGGIGSVGDLVVYSPRKLLPIPEGGLLVLRDTSADPDSGLQRPASAPGCNHEWIARQMIRRMIEALGISPRAVRERLEINGDAADGIEEGERLGCTRYNRGLLHLLEADLAHIISRRRTNYQRLLEETKLIKNAVPIFPVLGDGVCPYLFPLRMKKGRDRAVRDLKQRGIPAGIWPTLPAEVLADPQHLSARVLRDEIITLPVHQSLTAAHIRTLVKALTTVAGGLDIDAAGKELPSAHSSGGTQTA